jgi:hypothetical protein
VIEYCLLSADGQTDRVIEPDLRAVPMRIHQLSPIGLEWLASVCRVCL